MRWETILWVIHLNDFLIATRQWPQAGSFTGGTIAESFVTAASILLVYTGSPTLTVHISLCIAGLCTQLFATLPLVDIDQSVFMCNIHNWAKYLESQRNIWNDQNPAIINRFQKHGRANQYSKYETANGIEARIWKQNHSPTNHAKLIVAQT